MSRDLTVSNETARRYYELKQKQILLALEKEVEDAGKEVSTE
jgi:hypothetical protein